MKKLIYECSPLRATARGTNLRRLQFENNLNKARQACRLITDAGGIPISPALYFTTFLSDEDGEERKLGMDMGLEVLNICDELWIFTDNIISEGMLDEIIEAAILDIPIRKFDFNGVEDHSIQDFVDAIKRDAADAYDDSESDEDEPEDDDCDGCDDAIPENMLKFVFNGLYEFLHDDDIYRMDFKFSKDGNSVNSTSSTSNAKEDK